MTDFLVSDVSFLENGIELTFMRHPDDVRNEGQLLATHRYSISDTHPSYADEIEQLRDLVAEIARDVFEDFDDAPIAPAPADEREEDDEKGMGE